MSHKVSSLTFGILRSPVELRYWLPRRATISDPVALREEKPCLSRYDLSNRHAPETRCTVIITQPIAERTIHHLGQTLIEQPR